MTVISPSLLSCDFLNIESELAHFENVPDLWLHLDIMDGHFVPNTTFGQPIIKKIAKASTSKLDAHFMVTNPEFYVETLKDCALHNFTFHVEAVEDSLALILEAKKHFPSVGISIKPKTPLSALSHEVLEAIDLLLVMSVEPGFGGQSFIEGTYDKLDQIKAAKEAKGYSFEVQIDGGVSDANAQKLTQHGATNLVAGSYVFKAGPNEYLQRIESLRS
jgi:ribulose-phosphate 3-epimerase